MVMRRRRFKRSFAGKRAGRSFYWFRFGAFNLSLRDALNGILSDIILQESDWSNPTVSPNQTKRGGPRLERFIMDYGFALEATNDWFRASGQANIALIPEVMMWKQTDQFLSIVSSAASWDQTRDNQRIMMDEIPAGEREFVPIDDGFWTRTVQGRYETKSKVRLSEGALGVGMRIYGDIGHANVQGFTDWIRPTLLISVP